MDHKSCVAGASNQQLKMGVVARAAFLIDNASQWRRMRLCGPLQVKVTCSLGRIARFSFCLRVLLACQQLGMTVLQAGATRQSVKIHSILSNFVGSSP
jgi:hypothetical protein